MTIIFARFQRILYKKLIPLDYWSTIRLQKKSICQQTREATTIPGPPYWKALGKENLDLPGTFVCDRCLASYFFEQVKTWPEQKWTRQIWIRLVEYSSAKFSDPSEVPRFVRELIFSVFKEVKLICVRLIKSCSRVPAIILSVPYFLRKKYIFC